MDLLATTTASTTMTSRSAAHDREALAMAREELAAERVLGSSLRGKVAALDAECAQLREQHAAGDKAQRDLADKVATSAEVAARLDVQLRGANERIETLEAQLKRTTDDLEAKTALLAQANSAVERERTHSERVDRRCADEARACAVSLDEAHGELDRLRSRCAELSSQLARAHAAYEELRSAHEGQRQVSSALHVESGVALAVMGAECQALEEWCTATGAHWDLKLDEARTQAAASANRALRQAAQDVAVRAARRGCATCPR